MPSSFPESWSQNAPPSHRQSCCCGLNCPKYNGKEEASTHFGHALDDRATQGLLKMPFCLQTHTTYLLYHLTKQSFRMPDGK